MYPQTVMLLLRARTVARRWYGHRFARRSRKPLATGRAHPLLRHVFIARIRSVLPTDAESIKETGRSMRKQPGPDFQQRLQAKA
ncbi:hypothetical protein ABID08_003998 [Rhizobium binae]|uniref:Uncharacterized protein n=1 Tax=Rhizobium binae TaxID=1138190 RepID=A0ABV2MJK0_9HYPH